MNPVLTDSITETIIYLNQIGKAWESDFFQSDRLIRSGSYDTALDK
jgi:hypothetical protein